MWMWIIDSGLFTMQHFTMRTVTRIITLLTIVCVLVDAGYVQYTNARVARASNKTTCELPPQPPNGRWKLHPLHCTDQEECDVESGTTELPPGSRLVYSCNAGYKMTGSADVSCSIEGNWLTIPVCTAILCKSINTVSVDAACMYRGIWEQCDSPVLPGTTAILQCRNGYRSELNRILNRGESVICNDNGVWEPEPLRCRYAPECGVIPTLNTSLITGGLLTNITEFPWHASIYRDDPGQPKMFICGATIIRNNFLITAAHCVSLNGNQHIDANELYVMTGNIYRDYDSPLHNNAVVRKAKVKNIYIKCHFQGLETNFISDIAILELVDPFVLSLSLLPACVDFSIHRHLELKAGVYGKMASFGDGGATLQSLKLPYISYNECRSKSGNNALYITQDKFCAGYTNDSSICPGDSGSGLVIRSNGNWFLIGIASVFLGERIVGGEFHCDPHVYSLFTRVSYHIEWIQKIITSLDLNKPYTSCSNRL